MPLPDSFASNAAHAKDRVVSLALATALAAESILGLLVIDPCRCNSGSSKAASLAVRRRSGLGEEKSWENAHMPIDVG